MDPAVRYFDSINKVVNVSGYIFNINLLFLTKGNEAKISPSSPYSWLQHRQ